MSHEVTLEITEGEVMDAIADELVGTIASDLSKTFPATERATARAYVAKVMRRVADELDPR